MRLERHSFVRHGLRWLDPSIGANLGRRRVRRLSGRRVRTFSFWGVQPCSLKLRRPIGFLFVLCGSALSPRLFNGLRRCWSAPYRLSRPIRLPCIFRRALTWQSQNRWRSFDSRRSQCGRSVLLCRFCLVWGGFLWRISGEKEYFGFFFFIGRISVLLLVFLACKLNY